MKNLKLVVTKIYEFKNLDAIFDELSGNSDRSLSGTKNMHTKNSVQRLRQELPYKR